MIARLILVMLGMVVGVALAKGPGEAKATQPPALAFMLAASGLPQYCRGHHFVMLRRGDQPRPIVECR